MIGRVRIWLLTHPAVGRPVRVAALVWLLATAAVITAPQAVATTNEAVLGWTGIRDSYGVSPGEYYLATVGLQDRISQTGSPVSAADPGSWVRWLGHAAAVTANDMTAGALLTVEAGLFVGISALALWVFRVTVSSYWLLVVGQIAQGVTHAVIAVSSRLGLLLIAVPLGVFLGVLTVRRGQAGRGATMILTALAVPALSVAVFRDPATQLFGPDGVLAFGRQVGFSVAQAATRNGAVSGGGFDAQLDALTASIVTHVVREPLQLWNFGHVVDRVGSCGAAWSAAVRQGGPDTPVRAMQRCGDQAAVDYANHLDGGNVWIGAVMVVCALLLGWFLAASGWAVLRVSVTAIWTSATLLPALWLGGIPGGPQRHAVDRVWAFFRHGIEAMVYIVYVSVIVLAIDGLIARPLPAALGGTNPFAHVLIMGGLSVAAVMLLHHIRADLTGRGAGRGLLGRAAQAALGRGISRAAGKAGSLVGRGLRPRPGGAGTGPANQSPPWDTVDRLAADGDVLGEPRPGFAAVPANGAEPAGGERGPVGDGPVGDRAGPGTPRAGAVPATGVRTDGVQGADRPDSAPGSGPPAGGSGRYRGRIAAGAASGPDPSGAGIRLPDAAAVPPITQTATTGYGEDIPPPSDPPPAEEEPVSWPHPAPAGEAAATVDAITDSSAARS